MSALPFGMNKKLSHRSRRLSGLPDIGTTIPSRHKRFSKVRELCTIYSDNNTAVYTSQVCRILTAQCMRYCFSWNIPPSVPISSLIYVSSPVWG